MTTLILTIAIVAVAIAFLSISLILTGRSRVHGSCSATGDLAHEGIDANCEFCPNDEDEDQVTTLAKAGYPGRQNIISEEAYRGEDRNLFVEKLKYRTGKE